MADEIENTPVAPVATPAPATDTTTSRTTVPVSALFDENDLRMPDDKPADGTVTAPVVKPAEVPAAVPPVAADKPAEAPAAPAAAPAAKPAEAPVAKIKVGDKEYTEAELKEAMAKRTATDGQQPPAAAPAAAAPEAKPPTKEEIATAEAGWQKKFAADEGLAFAFSNDEVETLLSGGEDAGKLLNAKFTDAVTKAVMLARKSIYNEMNPTLSRIQDSLQPLMVNNTQVEAAAAEQQFFGAYPEFKGHEQVVRDVGTALLRQYPEQMAKMTREQQLAEVSSQADAILQSQFKHWNPNATGSWKDAAKVTPAAPAPVVPPAKPAAVATTTTTTTAPAAAPAAAAPAKPAVTPPGSNSPAGTPPGPVGKDWHKETAKSLQD